MARDQSDSYSGMENYHDAKDQMGFTSDYIPLPADASGRCSYGPKPAVSR